MTPNTIAELIKKYRDNTATDAEKEALMEWYRSKAHQDAEFPEDEEVAGASMLQRLETSIAPKRAIDRRNWFMAASVILLLGIGTVIVLRKSPLSQTPAVAQRQAPHDIGPGSNVAVLTLADGSKVSLTDSVKGNIADQSGIRVSRTADGQIVYTVAPQSQTAAAPDSNAALAFNKIEIPPAGQYQVVLPDGTKVWLNSASWLKFPVRFSPTERKVELSGEAYFEVQRQAGAPFRIVSLRQEIEVLGTQFNVHAYPDEAHIKTTLVDGSVRVSADANSVLLKPEQQSDLDDRLRVTHADVAAAIAWKNGYFRYTDERLEIIMKSVARWYNVKVNYEDETLKDEGLGVLSTRFANISSLLSYLEKGSDGEIRFTINGSTIHVSRKK